MYLITPSSVLQTQQENILFLMEWQKNKRSYPQKPSCFNQDSLLAGFGCGHHHGCSGHPHSHPKLLHTLNGSQGSAPICSFPFGI